MGISKTEAFSASDNQLAAMAKALAHPARIAILKVLLNRESCICGDLVEELPLAQSTISQHLNELKKAGLIKGEIDGPATCYCIDMKAWNKIAVRLAGFFARSEAALKKCC